MTFAPVFVPVTLDAWINYAEPTFANEENSGPRAYIAPIPKPNYNLYNTNDQSTNHDIFEHLRTRPPFSNGDPARRTFARSGIYLSWTIPRMYRTGLIASDGVKDFDQIRRLGGYPSPGSSVASNTGPLFRHVPSTWVVLRIIEPGDLGKIRAHKPKSGPDGGWTDPIDIPPADIGDVIENTMRAMTMFVVQSNVVRRCSDIPGTEDVEITTSPFIGDLSSPFPNDHAGTAYLGQTTLFKDWPGENDPKYPNDKPPTTVPVTVSNTANPYLADFQPQNGSVFSMFDNLSIMHANEVYQICDAKVSYSVIGYHDDPKDDPLAGYVQGQSACDRLKACQLTCDISSPGYAKFRDQYLDTGSPQYNSLRTFCHGSMFNVRFSQVADIPDTLIYPGDVVQQQFATAQPLSIGTNPMDALFGWLRAQDDDQSDLKAKLMKLQTFVLDSNDDLDSQLQAEDLLATNNFIPTLGGVEWQFVEPGKQPANATADSPPAIPSFKDAYLLQTLNGLQGLLDAQQRTRASLKRQMFELWWQSVVGQSKLSPDTLKELSERRASISKRLQDNLESPDTGITSLTTQIAGFVRDMNANNIPVQSVAAAGFYIQQDPTLLVAGFSSGWPQGFNDDLMVRMPEQYVKADSQTSVKLLIFFAKLLNTKFGRSKMGVIMSLLAEAVTLQQAPNLVASDPSKLPLYHPDRDRFQGKNGWFPLFIEWEIEYYHIPFENWELKPCGPESRYGWCLKDGIDISQLSDAQKDYRVLSGRSPVLPQAAATLESTLRQVFAKINPEQLDAIMDLDTRSNLLTEVKSLEYLSTPISGFFDQLTMRRQGAHFQPVSSSPIDGKPVIDIRARDAGNAIGMTDQDFDGLDTACSTTPLTESAEIPSDTDHFSPFKSCTHGQFRFTKLHIVDKFGQMVDGITTSMDLKGNKTTNPLFPCLGEAYSVQEVTGQPGRANTVIQREDGLNSFVQLPPSINQPARINARFVTQPSSWRRIQEWENPVRGWLVVNYANTSIQVYTSDGLFVREYSVISGTVSTRPFPEDQAVGSKLDPIMSDFLSRFSQPNYVLELFRNITRAVEATQASPSHYADTTLSALGKPLAFVTFGCSIELSQPPLEDPRLSSDTSNTKARPVTSYSFPVKIGDKDNVFDGLMNIFEEQGNGKFNFDNPMCYHDSNPARQPKLQALQPFHVDPTGLVEHASDLYTSTVDSALQVSAALVDPFTPVNIYSAILPIKQLIIPRWCVSSGLARITSFFRSGPNLLADDVPAFQASQEITQNYNLGFGGIPVSKDSVSLPAVIAGDWRWLQPYWVGNPNSQPPNNGTTHYNLLNVETASQAPLWEPPPCVVTEGYLQMAKPFSALQVSAKDNMAG